MPTIEIVRRQSHQHRQGWFSIQIDGWDTEYMNNPSQHFERMLGNLIGEGRNPTLVQTTMDANDRADEQSKYVLGRIVNRIAAGKLFPGGMPMNLFKSTDALPKGPQKLRSTIDDAARSFLDRGNFLVDVYDQAGKVVEQRQMTEDERVARIKSRDTKGDPVGEWKERRKAMIVSRRQEMEKLQSELPASDLKFRHKIVRRIAKLSAELARLEGSGIFCASHGFQYAFGQYLQAAINFVSNDIRMMPLMTNTTVDTERDAKDTMSDFTTLDEADGSGYSAGGVALDNQAVNIDDGNDRAECDSDDETISAFGACTRSLDGVALTKFVTDSANSIPLHWLEFASDKTPDGSDFVLTMNAEGFLQASG